MCTYINTLGQEKIISSYHDNFGKANIYFSDKDGNSNSLLFTKSNCKITAITAGDFDGNGQDEIVLAYLQNGKPRIYKTDDINNLEKTLIYSKSFVYWSVDALINGDMDGDGDVELFIGFNSNGQSTAIYKNENANSVGSSIYSHTSGYWKIGDITCGDFDGDGDDELISGFNSIDGPSIYKNETGTSIGTKIYDGSSYWILSSLAGGDLDLDGDDELVSGFNSIHEGPAIYKSEDANSVCDVKIYDKIESYWNLSSLIIEKNPMPEDEVVVINSIIPNNNGNSFYSSSSSSFNIYPNPSEGLIFLKTNFEDNNSFSFEIFNTNGQKIIEGTGKNGVKKIDLNKFPNGMYFINIRTNSKSYQKKFIVNKN